jgi:ADP-ribose pyrophosphatase YjhB (NUDIX family)
VSLPEKRSVALVIRSPRDPALVLAVLRPPDDEDLPNVWGLPAASLREGEAWEDAVRRAARDKLGASATPGRLLNEGFKDRARYRLVMRLYAAALEEGREPNVSSPAPGSSTQAEGGVGPTDITRYSAWKWADADALVPAASAGSLCARLFLESEGRG